MLSNHCQTHLSDIVNWSSKGTSSPHPLSREWIAIQLENLRQATAGARPVQFFDMTGQPERKGKEEEKSKRKVFKGGFLGKEKIVWRDWYFVPTLHNDLNGCNYFSLSANPTRHQSGYFFIPLRNLIFKNDGEKRRRPLLGRNLLAAN